MRNSIIFTLELPVGTSQKSFVVVRLRSRATMLRAAVTMRSKRGSFVSGINSTLRLRSNSSSHTTLSAFCRRVAPAAATRSCTVSRL